MANLRDGLFGQYYGSLFTESEPLNHTEQEKNATYIYSFLNASGWSINAVAAILGNMQAESSINPGRWQSDDVGNYSLGYGLVQWTPVTKYTDWCTSQGLADPSKMDTNLSRILYEVENGLQWIATSSYNLSFQEFSTSSESVSYLAKAFLLNYERPADQSTAVQNLRASFASNWYTYLTGVTPEPEPTPTNTPKKRKYNFLLLTARRRFIQWTHKRF